MSTKTSILLTNQNEHWYYDCHDDTINIEINNKTIDSFERDSEQTFVSFKNDSELGVELSKIIKKNEIGMKCKDCGINIEVINVKCSNCKEHTTTEEKEATKLSLIHLSQCHYVYYEALIKRMNIVLSQRQILADSYLEIGGEELLDRIKLINDEIKKMMYLNI